MPRSAYPMAFDAAPQDGRWMEDPATVAKVVKFLVSKLSPADLAELDGHLTDGTEPQAADSRLPDGDLKRDFLNYTPRNRRRVIASFDSARGPSSVVMTDAERQAIHDKLFPNSGRLK